MRHRAHALVLVAILSSLFARGGLAQAADSTAAPAVATGTRVRLTVALPFDDPLGRVREVRGELVRIGADSVVVRQGERSLAVPRRGVTAAAVSAGRTSRGRAALVGGTIGLGAGAVIGGTWAYLAYEPCGPGDFVFCGTRGGETALGALVLGLPAAAIGAVGGALWPRERWREVTLQQDARVGLMAAPGHIGLALRF